MSNVINFAVEIDSSKKDVALKAMALIAAMAEISMSEMASCIDGIEVMDPEEVKMIPKIGHGLKKVEETEEEETEEVEKPKKKRKSRAKKKADPEVEENETYGKKGLESADDAYFRIEAAKTANEKKVDRPDSAVDAYEAKKKKEEIAEKAGKSNLDVTIEDVRGLLKDVVNDNRDEIVAKLKSLGATSVSTLKEDKFGEMYEYLESLK